MTHAEPSPPESRAPGWGPWLRKRLPLLLIVAGLLMIGPNLIKREVELDFMLPSGAQRLRVEVLRGDAVFRGIEVALTGNETRHRETLSLTPGGYRIEASIMLPLETKTIEKSVELPEESPVEIRF